MVQFEGKYKRVKEEGFESILNKLEVGLILRKAANASNPTFTVTHLGGDKWKFVSSTILKSMETTFEINVEFEEKTVDGRKVKTIVTKPDDTTFVMEQKALKKNEKDMKVVRKFFDDRIEVQTFVEDAVCTEVYNRVQ